MCSTEKLTPSPTFAPYTPETKSNSTTPPFHHSPEKMKRPQSYELLIQVFLDYETAVPFCGVKLTMQGLDTLLLSGSATATGDAHRKEHSEQHFQHALEWSVSLSKHHSA